MSVLAVAQVGVEPTASFVLSEVVCRLPTEPQVAQSGSRTRKRSGLSRAALPCWRIRAKVVLDGLEPPIVTL